MPLAPATHWQVLQFLWGYSRRYRWIIVCMVFLLLLTTAFLLAQPFFYKETVDILSAGSAGDRAAFVLALRMLFLGVLCGTAHLFLYQIAGRMLGWVESHMMEEVHADVFAHVQHLSTGFHVNAFAGATARKITRGVDGIETMLDRLWFNFLPLAVLTIGYAVVLIIFEPLIGFVMIVGIMTYVPVAIVLNLHLARLFSWTDAQDSLITGSLVDAISGNPTVKAFGAERREERRHGSILHEWKDRLWISWQRSNTITLIQFLLLMAIELTLLTLAVWLWYQGRMTPGGFILVSFYVGQLWGYLLDIGQHVRQYLRASAHAEEMVGLYHMPVAVANQPHATSLCVLRGAIALHDITFSYENAPKPVFHKFSLDIEAGEKIALAGHSGGGKSTFVKLLQRFYDVQEGAILIDGQNIAEVTQKSLRRAIGLVPQDPILFHRTIAENIAYGKPKATEKEIVEAATKAHAHEFISRFPQGYQTLVGERGVKLSGGERQRVAIARAFLANCPILILDEATSSLDSISEQYIQDALLKLMEGRTTIVIAHRLSTIKHVDRILVIENGSVLEEGSHAALIRKKNGVYRGFYELQAGGFLGE